MNRDRAIGLALVAGAAVLWSLGGLGIKLVDAGYLAIAGYRSLFALPVLLIVVGARLRDAGPEARRPLVVSAAIAYATCVVTFVVATRMTTAANAIVLQYTGPVYVALLSGPLLGERLRRVDQLALVGCLVGLVIFAQEDLSGSGLGGIALALVSGVAFGALPLLLRLDQLRGGSDLASIVVIVLGNAFAVLPCLPTMIAEPPRDPTSWAVVIGLGTVQIGTAYLLYTAGLRRLRAVEASLVTTVEPVLNPVWVALGTREVPGVFAAVGGLIVVLSLAFQGLATVLPGRDRPETR